MARELIELAEEDELAQLLAPQWAKQHMLDKMANARNKHVTILKPVASTQVFIVRRSVAPCMSG